MGMKTTRMNLATLTYMLGHVLGAVIQPSMVFILQLYKKVLVGSSIDEIKIWKRMKYIYLGHCS